MTKLLLVYSSLILFHNTRFIASDEISGACYVNHVNECYCNPYSCTKETCEDPDGYVVGEWSSDCPFTCDPVQCASNTLPATDDDPPCTGPAEVQARFGLRLYRRKLIAREIVQKDEEGTFCHVTFRLCEGETMVTHNMDAGLGDYYRFAPTYEFYDWKGTTEYQYAGFAEPQTARSYSPVSSFNREKLEFIIKRDMGRYEGDWADCTPGKDCWFGVSAMVCEMPIGSDVLISKETDHSKVNPSHHYASTSTIDRSPGAGPYTINVIGQGIALTELNIAAMSELLNPFSSDGSFSTVQTFNYLWANSYWSNAKWVWEKTDPSDLARQLKKRMARYGIRFNLMHAISREQRPEAEFPRITSQVIGDAFKLTNTTNQDPNVKWLVVGSSSFKREIYLLVKDYGFDIDVCPDAERFGWPYCGPNALYGQVPLGADPKFRKRSPLFDYYAKMYPNDGN